MLNLPCGSGHLGFQLDTKIIILKKTMHSLLSIKFRVSDTFIFILP